MTDPTPTTAPWTTSDGVRLTDQTPTTEAGRRLLEVLRAQGTASIAAFGPADILAIEAEARADGDKARMMPAYQQGRADALREAAERVRGLPLKGSRASKVAQEGAADMRARAVRAILARLTREEGT